MYWSIVITVMGIILTIIINISIVSHWTGKLEQRITSAEKTMDRFEVMHNHHFDQSREHESTDQSHFKDNDRHWNPQERGWLKERFDEVGKRFDKLEEIIRESK